MKRSVGPRYWAPRPSDTEGHKPTAKGLIPLVEGSASSSAPSQPVPAPRIPTREQQEYPRVKPYGRGSLTKALSLVRDNPSQCAERLISRARADTSGAPASSREKTWEELALAAGFADPFKLTPDMVYTIMGALRWS